MSSFAVTMTNGDWITLNVGGQYFVTTKTTLCAKHADSVLAHLVTNALPSSTDKNGAILIDRSPKYFEPIINYLRHGQLVVDPGTNPAGVLEEAKFFGLDSMMEPLQKLVNIEESQHSDSAPLTRKDVVNALIFTSHLSELRFQGIDLSGSNLSFLDLRSINFKYCIFQNADLSCVDMSHCNLERADFRSAKMNGAILFGAKMLCTNFEAALMKECKFEDPGWPAELTTSNREAKSPNQEQHVSKVNMEGANLKGANLEGSQMSAVNLRVATLKNANLRNCILRSAIMAGADMENCDLSGSDLQETNLKGANFKGAIFGELTTPLHMSSFIR